MLMRGATRAVLLTKRHAFKVPRLASWRLFLCGLLANMQEREFSRTGWRELCPVLFSIPGGWLVVMPRAEPLSDYRWAEIDEWLPQNREGCDYVVPVERKRDSFGWLVEQGVGRIVAVDYGS